MRKQFLNVGVLLIFILALSGCGSASELNAQEKRNNFDLCKIEFFKQVSADEFKAHSDLLRVKLPEDVRVVVYIVLQQLLHQLD